MVGATGGFEAQFQEFVYYAGPIVQLLYWIVLMAAAVWAVLLFKRWVDFQTGAKRGDTATPAQDDSAGRTSTPINVDEFVE
jgi:hypothetical protein